MKQIDVSTIKQNLASAFPGLTSIIRSYFFTIVNNLESSNLQLPGMDKSSKVVDDHQALVLMYLQKEVFRKKAVFQRMYKSKTRDFGFKKILKRLRCKDYSH